MSEKQNVTASQPVTTDSPVQNVPDQAGAEVETAADEIGQVSQEYPEFVKDGALSLPAQAARFKEEGMSALEACRLYDLRRTKELYENLKTEIEAETANKVNAEASIGRASGGEAVEKDGYTSQEWDRLPQRIKEKFIRNGKIFEFMKRWSGKE